MIRGIGVDTVRISEIAHFLENETISQSYLKHTFTDQERKAGSLRTDTAEYFATRFAAKEAVFKALGHLTAAKVFDFRLVETLNAPDGSPYVHITDHLRQILLEAEVDRLHISITTEADFATAFVIAEKL